MPIRVIIQAVPSRLPTVLYLQKHLPHAEVVMDPDYGKPEVPNKAFVNFIRTLRLANNDPHLHLEDDIILTRDFLSKAETVIAERPSVIIQFFSMRKADLTIGSRWDRDYLMNQCVYFPAGYSSMIADYMTLEHQKTPERFGGMDTTIKQWLKSRKERYWIHCPSLVEHQVARSAIDRRRSSKRQSFTFVDPV